MTTYEQTALPDFDGATYVRPRDHSRLGAELIRVREAMHGIQGGWLTLEEVSRRTGGDPLPSVSARMRDLRKAKFGGHTVDRRYVGDGLWEYRLTFRHEPGDTCYRCGVGDLDSSG